MTMNNQETLLISEDELGIKYQEVNTLAAKLLPVLLADLEAVMADKNLLKEYEVKLLGELYARMVVSACLGYCPDVIGRDAIEGCNRLIKLTEEQNYDNE